MGFSRRTGHRARCTESGRSALARRGLARRSLFPRGRVQREHRLGPPLTKPGRLGSTTLTLFIWPTPTTTAALGSAGILRQPRDPVPWVFHSPSSKEPPAALRCGDRASCSWTDFDCVSSRPGTARTPGYRGGSRSLRARRLRPVTSSGPSVTGLRNRKRLRRLFLK